MRKKVLRIFSVGLILLGAFLRFNSAAMAASDETQSLNMEVQQLKQQVKELENKLGQPQSSGQAVNQSQFSDGWSPFSEMERMHNEMNRMMQNSFNQNSSSGKGVFNSNVSYDDNFDLKETAEAYVITFDMADFDKDDVRIEVKGNTLSVSAESHAKSEQNSPQGTAQAQHYGSFTQTIPLPKDAMADKMQTKQEDNKLVITLPKKKKSI